MKCIKCGTELNDGMAFCPNCGADQNADNKSNVNNTQFNYSNGSTYQQQSQQQWQPQQLYQSNPQYQQQNNGYAENNLQYGNAMPVKTKSKTPLIIALAVAIVIIIGLAVTCVVLVSSGNSSSKNSIGKSNSNSSNALKTSTAKETVTEFLEALVEGDYSEATEYVLSGDIDYLEFGEVDLSKSALKKEYQDLTGYKIYTVETLDKSETEEVRKYLDYSGEITAVAMVEIDFIYDYDDYDDGGVIAVETDNGWYIIGAFD